MKKCKIPVVSVKNPQSNVFQSLFWIANYLHSNEFVLRHMLLTTFFIL